MSRNLISTLEAFDLDFSNRAALAQSAAALHVMELQSIVQGLSDSKTYPQHENPAVSSMAMRHAILAAFENGRDSISDEDIQTALEKGIKTCKVCGTFAIREAGESDLEASEGDSTPVKSSRKVNAYVVVKRLVERNSDADKDTIVQQAQEQTDAAVSTLEQYFHKARRELGMATSGKPGRKSTGARETVQKIVDDNPGLERKEIVALAVEQGINRSTANVYAGDALKNKG